MHGVEAGDDATVSSSLLEATQANRRNACAIAGFAFGILSVLPIVSAIQILCPLIGLPLAIIGLKSRRRGLAVVGVVLSSLGLTLLIIGALLVGVLARFVNATAPHMGN